MTTPVRAGAHEIRDGVRLLRPDPDIPYRDGAEARLWEIVSSAKDLSSDSTELLEVAKGWAEQYHTHPARANILRAIDIPADATVLEIGSGCGPITRYLGETGAQVDSVEPVLPRARVGRSRTRDLPNVEVFCGNLEDVPRDPAYDLVVVVGVLEYVGGGKPDLVPYTAFLDECRTRLRPGGALVLAIENRLGVKYLVGAGEDHSGRIFHGIEGYPRLGPAYTFSATALVDLVSRSGFAPHLFAVFPDYKHTRVVMNTGELQSKAPDLLENLPTFPSRYAGTRVVRLASEERLWRQFVRDGLAANFANSFLVIGQTDEDSMLWPTDRLAKYFSVNRRREYAAATSVTVKNGAIRLDRAFSPEPGALLRGATSSWDYVPGRSFLEAFTAADDDGRRRLLREWHDLVSSTQREDRVSMDAIPSNVIETTTGELRLIDSEFHDSVPVERVIRRGLFWLAVNLGRTTPPETWAPARTIADIFNQLVELAGTEIDEDGIEELLDQEAGFQLVVTTNHVGPEALAELATTLRRTFATNLGDTPLGRRLHHQYDDAVAARNQLQELSNTQSQEVAELRRALEKSRSQKDRAERALVDIKKSRSYRLMSTVRRGVRKVIPVRR